MLWIFFLLWAASAAECAECPADVQMMIQVDRNYQTPCEDAVPWPCDNDVVASFPLQVINSIPPGDDRITACTEGRATAQVRRLDLDTGMYTTLCNIPGRCLNACGIHPQTNLIYCSDRPGNDNLVRVDCNVSVTDLEARNANDTLEAYVPVNGKLCFLGQVGGTFSANTDLDGNYWFKSDNNTFGNNGAGLFEITNATLNTLSGSMMPFTTGPRINGAGVNDVVVGRPNLARIFDLNVLNFDFGPTVGVGEQEYVVGCWSNFVYVQQVSGNVASAGLITLVMDGASPGQRGDGSRASGAQWLFNGSIYCAYNNGKDGVIQVLLNETSLTSSTSGTVRAGPVSSSATTSSNDGMNCLLAPSPFGPIIISTTSTTTHGGGRGDPHISTLGGEHYLLLGQGSFSFWRFSGVDAESLSGTLLKKVPVDFQIYAHYSGHQSWTKGLLLVDKSGGHQGYGSRALELTSEDCRWRSNVGGTTWTNVDEAKLISDGDAMTAFKLVQSESQKMHVELLMKTQTGWKTIGKLYAVCKAGYHINTEMKMFSKEDINRVQGQLGLHQSEHLIGAGAGLLETDQSRQRADEEFLLREDWVALGGSTGASVYLQETDEDGPAVLKSCSESERAIARELCVKFLGDSLEEAVHDFEEIMEECVFDVCAGGGEAAAELASDIMKAF